MRIDCPECGTKLEVPDDFPARPFCSSRCKLVDLGNWFDEKIRIAGQPANGEPGEGELSGDLSGMAIPEA